MALPAVARPPGRVGVGAVGGGLVAPISTVGGEVAVGGGGDAPCPTGWKHILIMFN